MRNKISTIAIILLFISVKLNAQLNDFSGINIGIIQTQLKAKALNVALHYLKAQDSMFKVQDPQFNWKQGLFQVSPEINMQTGTDDAFSAINIKATGMFMFFATTKIGTITTPNTAGLFHTLPISIGIETNDRFGNINAIGEVGYVPWYQSTSTKLPELLKHTRVGVLIQGGYKFFIDSAITTQFGGNTDQSLENQNDFLFRTKGILGFDTKKLLYNDLFQVSILGEGNLWYDFLNDAVYYKIDASMRFQIANGKYFDVKYQKGSGAPNFNQGSQFGTNLIVAF